MLNITLANGQRRSYQEYTLTQSSFVWKEANSNMSFKTNTHFLHELWFSPSSSTTNNGNNLKQGNKGLLLESYWLFVLLISHAEGAKEAETVFHKKIASKVKFLSYMNFIFFAFADVSSLNPMYGMRMGTPNLTTLDIHSFEL